MKKIAFALTLLSAFCLISCDPWEDDSYHDGTTPGEEVEVPGNWKLMSITLEEAIDLNGDGTASNDLMVETNCYQNELLAFNEDFTGVATSNSYADITIANETYTIDCVQEVEETPFTWAQTQNTVTFTMDTGSFNATLVENTLSFLIPEGFSVSDEEGNVTVSQNIVMVYQKVQ